jgi:hypothetical protein
VSWDDLIRSVFLFMPFAPEQDRRDALVRVWALLLEHFVEEHGGQ